MTFRTPSRSRKRVPGTRPHMTDPDLAMVLRIMEAWIREERWDRFSWMVVSRESGWSKNTLLVKVPLREKYAEVQAVLAKRRVKARKGRRLPEPYTLVLERRLEDLQQQVQELGRQLNDYRLRYQRWIKNCEDQRTRLAQVGLSFEALDKELPSVRERRIQGFKRVPKRSQM